MRMDYPNYPVNIVSPSFIRADTAHALLLSAVDRDFGAVHIQHHPVGRIDDLRLGDQIAADPRQTGCVSSSASNDCKREVSAVPRSKTCSEPMSL